MILALDTSTPQLSLALAEPGRILATVSVCSQQRHNESILPLLDQLFREAGRNAKDLTGVAVGLGPGSFTGVRVGIATGLGMAQALDLPILGVSSFLGIAAGSNAASVLVVEDARQDHFYTAWYVQRKAWEQEMPERLFSLADLGKQLPQAACLLSGPAASQVYEQLHLDERFSLAPDAERFPRAEVIARLADGTLESPVAGLLAKGGMSPDQMVPIYLRKTQAEEMMKRG